MRFLPLWHFLPRRVAEAEAPQESEDGPACAGAAHDDGTNVGGVDSGGNGDDDGDDDDNIPPPEFGDVDGVSTTPCVTVEVGNGGKAVQKTFQTDYDFRHGPAGRPNVGLTALSPYDYATAVLTNRGTAKKGGFSTDHPQSETHRQVRPSRPTVVGISPWHKVPRRVPGFWGSWVLGPLNLSAWFDLALTERHTISTYAFFAVTLFVTYKTRGALCKVVAAQPAPAGWDDWVDGVGDDDCGDDDACTWDAMDAGASLKWLRMLRACVRHRTASPTCSCCRGPLSSVAVPSTCDDAEGTVSAEGGGKRQKKEDRNDRDERVVFGSDFAKTVRSRNSAEDTVRRFIGELADSEFGFDQWDLSPDLCHLDVSRNESRWVQTKTKEGLLECLELPRPRPFEMRVAEFKTSLRGRLSGAGLVIPASALYEPPLLVDMSQLPSAEQVSGMDLGERAGDDDWVESDRRGVSDSSDVKAKARARVEEVLKSLPGPASPSSSVSAWSPTVEDLFQGVDNEISEAEVREEWLPEAQKRFTLDNYHGLQEGNDEARALNLLRHEQMAADGEDDDGDEGGESDYQKSSAATQKAEYNRQRRRDLDLAACMYDTEDGNEASSQAGASAGKKTPSFSFTVAETKLGLEDEVGWGDDGGDAPACNLSGHRGHRARCSGRSKGSGKNPKKIPTATQALGRIRKAQKAFLSHLANRPPVPASSPPRAVDGAGSTAMETGRANFDMYLQNLPGDDTGGEFSDDGSSSDESDRPACPPRFSRKPADTMRAERTPDDVRNVVSSILRTGAVDKKTGERRPVLRKQGAAILAATRNLLLRAQGKRVKAPVRMILSGPPGTGKSVVIECVQELAAKLGFRRQCINVAAPTGKAAALVRGNTLACLAGATTYTPRDHKLQTYWKDCHLLIIDEAYMVALANLGVAWGNLIRILDAEDIDLLLVGDPFQFSPIGGLPVYKSAFMGEVGTVAARAAVEKEMKNWSTKERVGWVLYHECDPEKNPDGGAVVWLDETKRTEGFKDWNEMMHLFRTFFTETLDGCKLEPSERVDAIKQTASDLKPMVLGTKDRRGLAWSCPLTITPRREVAGRLGRKLLFRHAKALERRVYRYVASETVHAGDSAGTPLKRFSPGLYDAVGQSFSKKTTEAPRELVTFVGCKMRITKNNTVDGDLFKLNGWVNGMDGVVNTIELHPDEPEDDGTGAFRDLHYPPIYIGFLPNLPSPLPDIHDKESDTDLPAGTFCITPATFDFEFKPKVSSWLAVCCCTHASGFASAPRLVLNESSLPIPCP